MHKEPMPADVRRLANHDEGVTFGRVTYKMGEDGKMWVDRRFPVTGPLREHKEEAPCAK